MPLQIRRGTEAERTAMTQPLAAGELIFVTNTNRLYMGNGTTNGGVPVTDYTDEQARDAVAPMLVNGTHSAISFVYDDALDKVNATVNLSDYQGVIKAASFNGSLVANDSSLLIDGNTGKFNLSGSVGTDIIPDTDVTYDLGSATYRFRDLYLSGSSIKLGAATITAVGDAVNLPLGSTMGGVPLAGGAGSDYNGNIIGDDSTIIVNAATKVVTAAGGFIGNVTGTVTGNAGSVTNGVYITDTGTVTNTMLAGSIADTKLSTISTAGKVSNSATTATNANTASAIVSRDGSGNFLANIISSDIIGNVTGNLTGNSNGFHTGDVKGSVFGDDSSVIVNAIDRVVTAAGFIGLLSGNVTGDLTGNSFGNVVGNLTGNSDGFHTGDVKGSVFGDDSSVIVNAIERVVTAAGGFIGNVTGNVAGSLTGNRVVLDQSLATTGFIIESEASGGAGDVFNINTHHSSADPTLSYFTRSRGTLAAPTPLLNSDLIYGLAFSGRSSDGTSSIAAAFGAGVAGAPSAGILPGSIILSTNTTAGVLTPKLSIGSDGLQTVVAPALVAGAGSGQVNVASIASWMKVNFNGVNYAVPMYTIVP